MAGTYVIPIPPGPDSVPLAKGQKFEFNAITPCKICFSVNALFQGLSGASFQVNSTLGPFTAPNADTHIDYNVVNPAQQCTVVRAGDTPKVIHVGSGVDKGKKK